MLKNAECYSKKISRDGTIRYLELLLYFPLEVYQIYYAYEKSYSNTVLQLYYVETPIK